MRGDFVIREPAEVFQRNDFAFVMCQRVQCFFKRESGFVSHSRLRSQERSLAEAFPRPTSSGQLVAAVSKQHVKPLVKRPRGIERADCLESVNKSVLDRVLSIVTIEQNHHRLRDRAFLISLHKVPENLPVALLTSLYGFGIFHR